MKISFRLGEKYGKVLIMGFGIVGMVIQVYVSSHMPSITLFLFFHNFLYGLCAGFVFLLPLKECQ